MSGTDILPAVVGFDTSNYRTSVAAVTLRGKILVNHRELLPVADGERGLRQSDAVFAHIRQLRNCEQELRLAMEPGRVQIVAVAASTKPRGEEDSYMPVFQVGHTAGSLLAASLNVPFYETDHQAGHLFAAMYRTGLVREKEILAVHLSGGTTDLLHMDSSGIRQIGGSADLHAGQLVDRAGVAMGLGFPAGEALEALAVQGHSEGRLGCSLEEGDLVCHLSGAETKVQQWIREETLPREDIAREIYDLLARTLIRMLQAAAAKTRVYDVLITGGVASSELLRQLLTERRAKARAPLNLHFGRQDLSGDNAVGVALIGVHRYMRSQGTEP